MKRCLVMLLLFVVLSADANAGGGGPMWIFPVGRLCVAQEPSYSATLIGQLVQQGRLELSSPQFTQCASTMHWIPDNVCKELMSFESEQDLSRTNLERFGSRHSAELKILSTAGPYVMEASEAEIAGRKLPECPSTAR